MSFDSVPLTDDVIDDALKFVRAANPFLKHAWGWDAGRFVDFRWGGNVLREEASPGFFERHGSIVRRDGAIVAVVVAETGDDDHCILTAGEDPATLDWALADLLHRRREAPIELLPSDDATWVHDVIARRGFSQGEIRGLEWGYDLGDVPEPFEPAGYVVDPIRGAVDHAGVGRCLAGAFGGDRDRTAVLASLATNPMYEPSLSIVARSADGEIAAYCKGEVDADTGVAGIDPVATHPDHQRRGLGRAVVLRCFAEQRRLGGTTSYIGSEPEGSPGSRLYPKLNPISVVSHSAWRRSPS